MMRSMSMPLSLGKEMHRSICAIFMPNNASCYQDRLGTNVAKTLKIKNVIFLLYYREVQVVAKAGSVLVQDSRLWHTGGVNTSDAVRTSVVVRYAPWWLSVEFGRTQVCAANNVVLFAPFYATNR